MALDRRSSPFDTKGGAPSSSFGSRPDITEKIEAIEFGSVRKRVCTQDRHGPFAAQGKRAVPLRLKDLDDLNFEALGWLGRIGIWVGVYLGFRERSRNHEGYLSRVCA